MNETKTWPWAWGGDRHKAILEERQILLSAQFDGTMDGEGWYRLACIRGVLDAIEEAGEKEDAESHG